MLTTGMVMVILGGVGVILFGIIFFVTLFGLGRKKRKTIEKIQRNL